jgi:hypothetical protein
MTRLAKTNQKHMSKNLELIAKAKEKALAKKAEQLKKNEEAINKLYPKEDTEK